MAVEGTNDRLKSIVLGWRESLGFFSFSFFFLLLSIARFSSRFFSQPLLTPSSEYR